MEKLRKISLAICTALALIALIVYAGDKPPASVERVMQSMLFYNPATCTLIPTGRAASGDASSTAMSNARLSREKCEAAIYFSALATNHAAQVATELATASALTIDFGWSFDNREPAALNYLAQEHWATTTNINGILHEDHYLEFSSAPSEAPTMVFSYQDLLGETYLATTITNSYPTLHAITLPSGVHSCYWFRCEVPAAFAHRLRTWEGEARFGGPIDSEYGFDVAGVFIIDDGAQIWQGRTITTEIGTNTVEFSNGIAISPFVASMAQPAPEPEERGILHTLGTPYRYARSLFSSPKINLTSNTLTKTTWQGSHTYKLAFPIKDPKK